MPRPWFVLILVAVLGLAWGLELDHRSALEREIAARDQSILVLRHTVTRDTASLAAAIVRWRTITHTDTLPGRVDTLPGRIDTIPLVRNILLAGDSLARSCSVTVHDCLALGDSLTRQVADLKKLVGGPWIQPSAELLTGPDGLRMAGEVTVGHRLQGVGRVEVPLTTTPTWRVGVRLQF